MLADSVEAAGKSVAGSGKPSPKRFETLIDSIFKARMEDGQLDDCPLTFADLGRIRETFVSILSGMYHFRIQYPGQTGLEEEAQAGAEKGTVEPTRAVPEALSENSDGSEGAPRVSDESDPESQP